MEKKVSVMKQMNDTIAAYLDYILRANESVDATFDYIGRKFHCDRIYIFEIKKEIMNNTYEWCGEGIIPQKDMLQDESITIIDPWMKVFREDRSVVIYDLEEIREEHPGVYAGLKPQNINSLICCPFKEGGEITGFIGVDNPRRDEIDEIVDFLNYISGYIVGVINRTNQNAQLDYRCYHDILTGALSLQSLEDFPKIVGEFETLGIIHCDITGVKIIDEYRGHQEADMAIVRTYKLLREVFPAERIYRVCGIKFVIVCTDCAEHEFNEKVKILKELLEQHDQVISIGTVWRDGGNFDFNLMMGYAEKDMFRERARSRNSANLLSGAHTMEFGGTGNKEFIQFINNNYFSTEVLFNSVALFGTNYLFFGDLQTNSFYISDNMRDNFGFANNIVPNLLYEWEKRISNQDDLALYREDVNEIINQKKDVHDLRYRVRDIHGSDIWIHCRGFVHWNEDKSVPLFFSGSFTSQEHDFIVDPITNFPREIAATDRIQLLDSGGFMTTVIGFGLNNFSEINELKGRAVADQLLGDIAHGLLSDYEGKLQFYRLDGLRFVAIVSPTCEEDVEDMVVGIRQVIASQYRSHSIVVNNPCALCILVAKPGASMPYEVLSNVISMISLAKNSPDLEYLIHSEESLEKQHRRAEMVMELNNNVENDCENFRIVIQPTVSARDNKISGGEVLLRWRFHGKDVSPEIFIEILEKNRQIHSVGRWVFEQTVRAATRSLVMNPDLYLSFNLSYLQILDPSFIPHMKQVLDTYRLNPSRLVLELTETHFDDSPQKLQAFFETCKEMGINIALDDFGKGYSSLGLLLKYPTQIVKLDRSILNEMANSEDNLKFITSVVYACHAFGKKVCAEGVETDVELGTMKNAKCDLIQGYYFSKPLEVEDFYRLISERKYF